MQYLETMSVSFLEGRCHFSVQSFCQVRLVTPLIVAGQGSLSITSPWSLLKPMSIESVMPSNHLILCCPFLFLPPIPPSIRVFSNESVLNIRWSKYWSFIFSIRPSNEYSVKKKNKKPRIENQGTHPHKQTQPIFDRGIKAFHWISTNNTKVIGHP